MSEEQALLIIADIAGYTRFMKLHHLSLAHSQDIIGRLLEAVVNAVPSLQLVELEGDAAFFFAPYLTGEEAATATAAAEHSLAMHQAFHAQQARMVALNMCSCDGCVQAGELKVKFVAHVGEVAHQTIKRRTQLVGVDVIVVHRMLKSSVPVPEYILMSEPLYEQSDPAMRNRAQLVEQELEGLGSTQGYFVSMDDLAREPPAPPAATPSGRLRETMGVMLRGMPYMLGFKPARLRARR